MLLRDKIMQWQYWVEGYFGSTCHSYQTLETHLLTLAVAVVQLIATVVSLEPNCWKTKFRRLGSSVIVHPNKLN